MKYIIILLFIVFIIDWENRNKSTYSIMLIIFLSSFVANPLISYGVHIGISGVLVWVVFLLRQLKSNNKVVGIISWKMYGVIIGLAVYGLILGLTNVDNLRISLNKESNLVQIVNVTFYLFTIAIFIRISESSFFNIQRRYLLIKVFVFSVFFHLITILVINFGYGSIIPEFLTGSATIMEESDKDLLGVVRNAGLIGDYELIVDYSIMVLLFSILLVLHKKNKLIGYCGIISAIIIGSFSGTRSFFVVLTLIIILISFFNILFVRRKLQIIKMIVLFLLLFGILYFFLLKDLVVFQRLLFAFDLFDSGAGVQQVANRDFSSYLPHFFDITPFSGYGSMFFHSLYDNSLVSHNIFLALYVKYGFFGVFPYTLLLLFLLKKLIILVSKLKEGNLKIETILILSFFIGLIFQEYKVSAIRYFNTILMYTIYFMFLYSHIRLFEIKINNKKK